MVKSDSTDPSEKTPAQVRAGANPVPVPNPIGLLDSGASVIQDVVKTLPSSPGVYQMLNERGEALYVGKARSLKNRVPAYTRLAQLPNRLRRMVAETRSMEIVTTHTEVEALLLEINLIKQLKPRYNVLLRDDKSFPHILLARDHEFPQIIKHRGSQKRPGNYFGPFASAGAVNRTLTALEKAFLLRSCSDSIFRSRSRPCLLHQIKRCSAPCTGLISKNDYAKLVDEAYRFLTGESKLIQDTMVKRMNEAATGLDFETAAAYRDRIRALAHVTSHQDINVPGVGDADVFALAEKEGQTCIQAFFFRGGQNFGGRAFFPSQVRDLTPAEAMLAFLGQFYSDRPPPAQVLLSLKPTDVNLLEEALSLKAERRVYIRAPSRGAKRRLIDHAHSNAQDALGRRLSESATHRRLLQNVAEAFELDSTPERIEIFDNSHLSGSNPVGAMVVVGPLGFEKNQYRKFNIRNASGNDDFDMMREVMSRRFKRAQQAEEAGEEVVWPDLLLIDGGKGQLSAVTDILDELGINSVTAVGIAKGPERDAGRERFFMVGRDPFMLPPNSPVLHYLQRLRDEAHRYVIGAQRQRRAKAISENPLDQISGVGASRKRALLQHFGSAKAVARAGLEDLQSTAGVSKALAQRIYDHFNAG
ncbi:MAG: excinuclease ABC subunit UvrC [Rhodospirillales bacterium]